MKKKSDTREADTKGGEAAAGSASPPAGAPAGSDAGAAGAPPPAGGEPGADFAGLEAEITSLKERLLQARADLDNQAKRFGRERQVVRDEITARLAREMIEVVDNLDLVLGNLPEAERAGALAQGVALTRTVLLDKLRSFGVEPIEALDRPFDPFQHEALLQEERRDVAPGTVIGEISRGYRLGSQLVRAAKVRVSKAPAEPAEASESGGDDGTNGRS